MRRRAAGPLHDLIDNVLVPSAVLTGVLAVAVGLRVAFGRRAAASQVDQYYWLLAARHWRKTRGFSVRIPGKYLLEDDTQAYPPAFGFMLGRLPEAVLGRWPIALSLVADVLTLAVLGASLIFLRVEFAALAAALAAAAVAPALITYNTQINPRAFGQLFLTAFVVLEVVAAGASLTGWAAALVWAGAVAMAALVVLTHKMSTQLMAVLWPLLAIALGSIPAAAVPPVGILVAALVTGPRFAAYQWRAHWDVVRFWNRHHASLGAHPFAHSPLYGDPTRLGQAAYHQGLAAAPRHLATIIGYAPLNFAVPGLLLLGPVPPAWLVTWFFATYAVVLLTLFVRPLKCYGGGHLYVINAVAPGAIWWGLGLSNGTAAEWALFVVGLGLSVLSLAIAWRRIGQRPNASDRGFAALIDGLGQRPAGRVAVFPLTAAEAIAYKTDHAVLWGGHGYGFKRLEGLFPVVTKPLRDILHENQIDWLAWNTRYWPDGAKVVRDEDLAREDADTFDDWRLVPVLGPSG